MAASMASCTLLISSITSSISSADASAILLPSSSCLRQQGARAGHGLFDVAAHVGGLVQARLLRHEADAEAGRQPGRAVEVGLDAGHDAQQRALAGAVAADDADLGAGVEGQPDVLEDLALAVGFGEVLDCVDVLFRHVVCFNPWTRSHPERVIVLG